MQSVNYNLKARPSVYMQATCKLVILTKAKACPRTGCVPSRHTVLPALQGGSGGKEGRRTEKRTMTVCGNPCWIEERLTASLQSSSFIVKNTTDGVVTSLLFSWKLCREQRRLPTIMHMWGANPKHLQRSTCWAGPGKEEHHYHCGQEGIDFPIHG